MGPSGPARVTSAPPSLAPRVMASTRPQRTGRWSGLLTSSAPVKPAGERARPSAWGAPGSVMAITWRMTKLRTGSRSPMKMSHCPGSMREGRPGTSASNTTPVASVTVSDSPSMWRAAA